MPGTARAAAASAAAPSSPIQENDPMSGWTRWCAALALAGAAVAGGMPGAGAQDSATPVPLMSADFEQPFAGRAPGWVVNW